MDDPVPGSAFPILLLYFLPAVIAVFRWHPNSLPIVLLNLLAGWTLIGWVVALVWSTTHIPRPIASSAPTTAAAPPQGSGIAGMVILGIVVLLLVGGYWRYNAEPKASVEAAVPAEPPAPEPASYDPAASLDLDGKRQTSILGAGFSCASVVRSVMRDDGGADVWCLRIGDDANAPTDRHLHYIVSPLGRVRRASS